MYKNPDFQFQKAFLIIMHIEQSKVFNLTHFFDNQAYLWSLVNLALMTFIKTKQKAGEAQDDTNHSLLFFLLSLSNQMRENMKKK